MQGVRIHIIAGLVIFALALVGAAQAQTPPDGSQGTQVVPQQTPPADTGPGSQVTPPSQTTPPEQSTPPGQTTPPDQSTPPEQSTPPDDGEEGEVPPDEGDQPEGDDSDEPEVTVATPRFTG